MLRQSSGSQALADYSVTATENVARGSAGLIIFGEDPKIWSGEQECNFLVVQDLFITETAKKADVIFPMAVYPEISGTFMDGNRRTQKCNKAVEAPIMYGTPEIAQKIAEKIKGLIPAEISDDLYIDMKSDKSYMASIMVTDGFRTTKKEVKVQLQVTKETVMFEEAVQTCSLIKAIDADLHRLKNDTCL
jgi:predicted molibdopterin-dependent oxidoreductase YjgC